jgi:hypothetical protein
MEGIMWKNPSSLFLLWINQWLKFKAQKHYCFISTIFFEVSVEANYQFDFSTAEILSPLCWGKIPIWFFSLSPNQLRSALESLSACWE